MSAVEEHFLNTKKFQLQKKYSNVSLSYDFPYAIAQKHTLVPHGFHFQVFFF